MSISTCSLVDERRGMSLYHGKCNVLCFKTGPGMTSGNVASGEDIDVLRMYNTYTCIGAPRLASLNADKADLAGSNDLTPERLSNV